MDWGSKVRPLWQRLLIGLLFVVAAVAVRLALFSAVGRALPYLIFYPMVMLAALVAGLEAGLLTTALLALLAYAWIQEATLSPTEWVGLAIFVVASVLVAFVADAMRRAQARTRLAQQEVEAANAQLRTEAAERARAEVALRESENHYRMLFSSSPIGVSLQEVICDEQGRAVDYRFLQVNSAFEWIMGRSADELLHRTMREVMPQIDAALVESYCRVGLTGEPERFSRFHSPLDREFSASLYSPERGRFVMLLLDVTDLTAAKAELTRQNEELRRWVEATRGREGRVLELKKEINALSALLHERPRFQSAIQDGEADASAGRESVPDRSKQ